MITEAINTLAQPYLNPASPDILTSPSPWENSRTATPTVAQPHPTSPPAPPIQISSLPHHQSKSRAPNLQAPDQSAANQFPVASSNQPCDGVHVDPSADLRPATETGHDVDDTQTPIHESGNKEFVDSSLTGPQQVPEKEKDKP